MPKGIVKCGNCEQWDLFRDGNKGLEYSLSVVSDKVSTLQMIEGFYYMVIPEIALSAEGGTFHRLVFGQHPDADVPLTLWMCQLWDQTGSQNEDDPSQLLWEGRLGAVYKYTSRKLMRSDGLAGAHPPSSDPHTSWYQITIGEHPRELYAAPYSLLKLPYDAGIKACEQCFD